MFKKIINTGLSQVIGLLFTFIIGVIISRVYGPEGKGILALLILIPTIISTYVSFSIEEGFLYHIGKEDISKKNFNPLLIKSLFIFSPFFLGIYIIFFFFIDNYQYYFLPQILLIIFLLFGSIFDFGLRGVLNFKRFNLIQILKPLIVFIGLLFIIFLDLPSKDIIWAYTISYGFILFLQYSSIKKSLTSNFKTLRYRKIFDYSYKVHFFKILNFTEAKFDILLIGFFLAVSEVGIYSVAVGLTAIFQAVIQTSITTILYPIIIKSDFLKQIELTQKYFKLSFSLAFIFLIGLLLGGNFFIVTVYGSDFSSAYLPMIILLFGALIKSPAACINSYFKAIGRPEELYRSSIFTVIINIILCFALITNYGIIGAAFASGISYMTYSFIMMFKFVKSSGLPFHNLFPNLSDLKMALNFIRHTNNNFHDDSE